MHETCKGGLQCLSQTLNIKSCVTYQDVNCLHFKEMLGVFQAHTF